MSAVDVWNTYAEWPEARCLASIDLLQTQIASGATQITSASGGAGYQTPDQAKYTVWELRCQVASLRGLPRPPPPPKVDRRKTRVTWLRPTHDSGY